MRTFLDSFPHVQVWSAPPLGSHQGIYLIGSRKPISDIAERIQSGFRDAAAVQDLREWDATCDSAEKMIGLYLTDETGLRKYLGDGPVITDDYPYTEFPLWRSLRRDRSYLDEFRAPELRAELGVR
jgi:hypothetical protein